MESFEGSRRRDSRTPLPPAERRVPREPEPLEQRLDRWMSTGRQLVEGVSGGRPGSRQGSRRPEGRPSSRGGIDGLGRWVEDRLDWLLDDSDDWPEPWQQAERRRRDASEPPATRRPRQPDPDVGLTRRSRRPLEAISLRGSALADPAAPAAAKPATRAAGQGAAKAGAAQPVTAQPVTAQPLAEPAERGPSPAAARRVQPQAAGEPNLGQGWSDAGQDWPDDEAFSLPRWQRPDPPLRRMDPLQAELQQRGRQQAGGDATQASAPARPLPRSSRRR